MFLCFQNLFPGSSERCAFSSDSQGLGKAGSGGQLTPEIRSWGPKLHVALMDINVSCCMIKRGFWHWLPCWKKWFPGAWWSFGNTCSLVRHSLLSVHRPDFFSMTCPPFPFMFWRWR